MTRVPPGHPQAASAADAAGPSAAPQLSPISLLHKKYKSMRSDNLAALFQAQPELWREYHEIADANEASFPPDEVPYRRVAARLRAYFERIPAGKPKTIVDLGCGRARLHGEFADRPALTFVNIDHVAGAAGVTVADIAHTGLEAGVADVAVLCLALWGSNHDEYFAEAYRILDPGGRLIVVEPGERWRDAETGTSAVDLYVALLAHGFEVVHEDVMAGAHEKKFALFEARKS
jgi:SAM-dependent methyltransferase